MKNLVIIFFVCVIPYMADAQEYRRARLSFETCPSVTLDSGETVLKHDGCTELLQGPGYCVCVTKKKVRVKNEITSLVSSKRKSMYVCKRKGKTRTRWLKANDNKTGCTLLSNEQDLFPGVGGIKTSRELKMCKKLCPDVADLCETKNPINEHSWGRFPHCAKEEGCEKYCPKKVQNNR